MLNLYTPVNEFEERVSVSFIRTIQVRSPRLSFPLIHQHSLLNGNLQFIEGKCGFVIVLSHSDSALTFGNRLLEKMQ